MYDAAKDIVIGKTGNCQVSLEDFLALLHSGMSLSQYRTIPTTVNTVLVQSYDLIAPMTADFGQ